MLKDITRFNFPIHNGLSDIENTALLYHSYKLYSGKGTHPLDKACSSTVTIESKRPSLNSLKSLFLHCPHFI